MPLISFEGIDGAGKTTQVRTLGERLEREGHEALMLREPGGTALGEAMREFLSGAREVEIDPTAELLLFAVARAQLMADVITPALKAGRLVIMDRFIGSTIAYQGYGRGLGDTAEAACSLATGGLVPDLTILLDLDPEQRRARLAGRGQPDRIESAGDAFFTAVREGYLQQARSHPERFSVIDAGGTLEEVSERIWWEIASRGYLRTAIDDDLLGDDGLNW